MPPADPTPWWQRLFRRPAPASAGPADDALEQWKSPDRAIAYGQRIIVFGLGVFFAWSALAPIDEGVPAPGNVAVESGRKAIATLTAGLVARIGVSENQQVKAGDELVALDDTQTKAAYDSALQQLFAMSAKLARLEAEQRRENQLRLPEELIGYDNEAWARELLANEVSLLATRNEGFESEMGILRERIAASEERLRGARQQLQSRRQQLIILGEQVKGLGKLVDAGHSPRSQLLETQRVMLETERLVQELETSIAIGANSVTELKLQQTQRRKEIQREIETGIVDARRELGLLKERAKTTRNEYERTILKAPIDGQVVALQGLAPGSPVSNGMHLMDIIPAGDRLLIDVRVAPHLIDRVHPGLEADVRINAFPEEPQLVVPGQVQSLSTDQMLNTSTGEAYYLARISITSAGLELLGSRKLRPGMPVEAIIKTGERSFLMYLIKPLANRLLSSFREP